MPPRVLIKGGVAAAMQVSLPGFNVFTASLDQMAFDARFGFLQEIKRSSGSFGNGGREETNGGTRSVVHFWDYALSQPPLVLVRFQRLGLPFAEGFSYFKIFGNQAGIGDGFVNLTAIATATNVTFQYTLTNNGIDTNPNKGGGVTWETYIFDYVAFRPLNS